MRRLEYLSGVRTGFKYGREDRGFGILQRGWGDKGAGLRKDRRERKTLGLGEHGGTSIQYILQSLGPGAF